MEQVSLIDYAAVTIVIVVWWIQYYATHLPPGGEGMHTEDIAIMGAAFDRHASTQEMQASTPKQEILNHILTLSGHADVDVFLKGAQSAYEIISTAFAEGDIEPHTSLLSDDICADFRHIIAGRNKSGEDASFTLIGFNSTDIIDAGFSGSIAWLAVKFGVDAVAFVKKGKDQVVAGDQNRVVKLTEIWTFERDLEVKKPVWTLAATEPVT